ncbi:hypothetical protein, partial [Clostridium perfringens]|uniref:hypothetical protein n=1 Tax=Clostridium perfringens TaxID=1502 RepID=UPI002ACD8400
PPPSSAASVGSKRHGYDKAVKVSFDEGTATLDEAEFTNESEVSVEGQHTLVVTDEAGNKTTLTFTVDTIAPQIIIAGVKDGEVYKNTTIKPEVVVNESAKITYELDGKVVELLGEIDAIGKHYLEITAV